MSFFAKYPVSGSGTGGGITTYATASLLPPTAADGAAAITLDTDTLYIFHLATNTWYPVASPTSYTASHNYAQYFTLTPADIANKFVTLSTMPAAPTQAQMTILGGVLQVYGTDYTISGNTLSWNGTDLDGFLTSGDELYVFYW